MEQPKSADLLIGIISFLLGLVAYATRDDNTPSQTIRALQEIAPVEIWGLLLISYGSILVASTGMNRPGMKVIAGGLGTFTWVAIVVTLLLFYGTLSGVITGLIIYSVFALFSTWSFINAQEEHRLRKIFGANFQRVIEEEMLQQLILIREKLDEVEFEGK